MTAPAMNRTAADIVGQVAIIRGREYYVRTAYPNSPHTAAVTLFRLDDWADMSGKLSLASTVFRPAARDEIAKVQALEEEAAAYTLGSLVTMKAPRNAAERGYYVVTGVNEKTLSIARLGGDGGRYLRIGRSGVKMIDPAEVLS